MRATLRITRLELNVLFYSPIAWFLAVVFLFQCGLIYTGKLDFYFSLQGLEGLHHNTTTSLTNVIMGKSAFGDGLLFQIISKIYLYVPLLTMGLISREVSSGTIKLLYSSPLKIREIIAGKFIAMMVYNLVLIFILSIFIISALINIKSADYGLVFSGLAGIYLLLNAYTSIGLFMSCLTSYQIVAALLTLVIFATLEFIGSIWQDVYLLSDFTYFLSISGRTENMLMGLISTKDLFYFIIITGMFLGFSICKLNTERNPESNATIAGRYLFLFLFCLLIGYITSVPKLITYYDVTQNKSMTLTPNTQQILKKMTGDSIEVISYINLLDSRFWSGRPIDRKVDLKRWEPYLRFKHDINLKYVYYYNSEDPKLFRDHPRMTLNQIARKYADNFKVSLDNFKTPAQIRKVIDLKPEQYRYVMELKYKGTSTFLRLFDDPQQFPGEAEIDAALTRLNSGPSKIAFLTGESERSIYKSNDKDYQTLTTDITYRDALVNQGFDVKNILLEHQDLPPDIAALVIADPRSQFSAEAFNKIKHFIDAGGNLLIAAEPDKQAIINPVLKLLHIGLLDGMLLQRSDKVSPDMLIPYLTANAHLLSGKLDYFIRDSIGVYMPGAAGLTFTNNGRFHITPLLMTDQRYVWNTKSLLVPNSENMALSEAHTQVQPSIPVSIALTRLINGKSQRIAIIGDADFASNTELRRGGNANYEFCAAIISWFTKGKFPINTSRPGFADNLLNLNFEKLNTLKIVYLALLPGILLALASAFLLRRRRQ